MTITITEIELSLVRLDLIHEFETSSHRKSHLDHIVVRATASDGTVGWGECASPSDPYYCSESTESCWYVLSEHLAPMVLGRPWEHPDDAAALTTRLSGNHFARAGLDMACWDLYGQARGETLATSSAAPPRGSARVSVSVSSRPSTLSWTRSPGMSATATAASSSSAARAGTSSRYGPYARPSPVSPSRSTPTPATGPTPPSTWPPSPPSTTRAC